MAKGLFLMSSLIFLLVSISLVGILGVGSIFVEKAFSIPSDKGPPEHEKIVFIHYYKPNHVSDPNCDKKCEGNDQNKTFLLMSGGIKWANLPIDYLISDQFSPWEVTAIKNSADTWDEALDFRSGSAINLFGDNPSGTTQTNAGVNDGKNIIVKGDLASNVIGQTSFWYNTQTKQVVDADMVLNYVDFSWSTAPGGTTGSMDVQNIVTHELGHFLVLNDLSGKKTSALTLYGSSDTGEINKRTTGLGDELGVTELYASSDTGGDDGDGPDCSKSKSKKWC